MRYRQKLLRVAERYQAVTGKSLATVGNLIAGNNALFTNLAAGRTCTLETADNALEWFSRHWPEGAEWPPEVERPSVAPEAAEA